MEGAFLHPSDGEERIRVPSDKTTVGRGPLLRVSDKRVSRLHATLETDSDNRLVFIPIHTNPCYYRPSGEKEFRTLTKFKPQTLEDGDDIALVPDSTYFTVRYATLDSDEKPDISEAKLAPEDNGETSVNGTSPSPPETNKSKKVKVEMAMPLNKKRVLPSWMVGAAKRTGATSSQSPTKTPTKPRVAQNVRAPAKKKRAPPSDEDADEAVEVKKTPTKRRAAKREPEEEEDEDNSQTTRRPRAASQRKPKYKDGAVSEDDFDLSDDNDVYKAKDDSDFVIDQEESGSDWEASQGSRKGKGRGKGPSPKKGKTTPGKRGRKKKKHSDSDDLSEEEYVPRPTKRRASVVKKPRESDEESEEDYKPKPTKRRGAPAKKPAAATAESEEEEEEDAGGKGEKKRKGKKRKSCMFGAKCYRKNPVHFKDYCHPGDSSYEEAESEDEEMKKPTKRPRRAARESDKKSVLAGASDDDGDVNTYNYDDSFINDNAKSSSGESLFDPGEEDSDWEPDTLEEDVSLLKKEARGFMKNKKMAKPTKHK